MSDRVEGDRPDVPEVSELERLHAERDALRAEVERLTAELAAEEAGDD